MDADTNDSTGKDALTTSSQEEADATKLDDTTTGDSIRDDTLPSSSTPSSAKVKIHFVAAGSAPILKRTKFQVNADQRFASVHVFLRKLLKLSPAGDKQDGAASSNSLFLYCHSAFVPSPDHLIGELRDSFAVRDELIIHYSLQEAWG